MTSVSQRLLYLATIRDALFYAAEDHIRDLNTIDYVITDFCLFNDDVEF